MNKLIPIAIAILALVTVVVLYVIKTRKCVFKMWRGSVPIQGNIVYFIWTKISDKKWVSLNYSKDDKGNFGNVGALVWKVESCDSTSVVLSHQAVTIMITETSILEHDNGVFTDIGISGSISTIPNTAWICSNNIFITLGNGDDTHSLIVLLEGKTWLMPVSSTQKDEKGNTIIDETTKKPKVFDSYIIGDAVTSYDPATGQIKIGSLQNLSGADSLVISNKTLSKYNAGKYLGDIANGAYL